MCEEVDSELRDYVIEALEKNGSLAQIRASLRANVFLSFEEDSEDLNHNPNLDCLLKLPEGVVALCIVHEFLESLNLTNTLSVFSSETRQGKPYKYVGRKNIIQKLKMNNVPPQEPILVSILKKFLRPMSQKVDQGGDDQNCTYIVHEDSSTNSSTTSSQTNSNSENSNLEIPLDMSDTDTSSDSREKTSSEYIPNKNVIIVDSDEEKSKPIVKYNQENCTDNQYNSCNNEENYVNSKSNENNAKSITNANINSYFENNTVKLPLDVHSSSESQSKVSNYEVSMKESTDNQLQNYSLDFSDSPRFNNQKSLDSPNKHGPSNHEPLESPHLNSHSSISISDVADLLEDSDISLTGTKPDDNFNNIDKNKENKYNSDDSGDSVPSISNLSLNFHSE